MLLNFIRNFIVLVAAILVTVTAVPATAGQIEARDNCDSDTDNAVPFYRAWRSQYTDHFYSAYYGEIENSINLSSTFQGAMGLIFRDPAVSTTLFYRLYNAPDSDHFYTTNQTEADYAVKSLDYNDEGTAGYVYTTQICASIPLYRLYSASIVDHLYTINETEREYAIAHLGYVDEGIACYVLPTLWS